MYGDVFGNRLTDAVPTGDDGTDSHVSWAPVRDPVGPSRDAYGMNIGLELFAHVLAALSPRGLTSCAGLRCCDALDQRAGPLAMALINQDQQ